MIDGSSKEEDMLTEPGNLSVNENLQHSISRSHDLLEGRESNCSFWVYILRCSDNSLYTGYTSDLNKRFTAHQKKKGAKYTRSRLPVSLVWKQGFKTRSEAMQREKKIKTFALKQKEALIKDSKLKKEKSIKEE